MPCRDAATRASPAPTVCARCASPTSTRRWARSSARHVTQIVSLLCPDRVRLTAPVSVLRLLAAVPAQQRLATGVAVRGRVRVPRFVHRTKRRGTFACFLSFGLSAWPALLVHSCCVCACVCSPATCARRGRSRRSRALRSAAFLADSRCVRAWLVTDALSCVPHRRARPARRRPAWPQ